VKDERVKSLRGERGAGVEISGEGGSALRLTTRAARKGDDMTRSEDRRAANRRTGLMLAAVAFAFFVFVILKYKVFGQ
jgi:hypothetical protein